MRAALVAGLLTPMSTATKAETVNLFAAGSLRAALTEVVESFESKHRGKVEIAATFAASGLLRERIEKGEPAHVFASADTGHPKTLAAAGRTGPVTIFARNQLCALAREGLSITPDNLLATLLDQGVRVGTSTPKADPSGDYAFALFAKAEAFKPGAKAALEAKALLLTGGPSSDKAPAGRNQYAWVMEGGRADVFLTYCTNAVLAKKELATLQIAQIPRHLNVGAEYGMVVLKDAPPQALELARFVTGADGQAILEKYGFGRGDPTK
jgi:ABC-type molybdate transport system substrate-binding protein